MVKSIVRLLAHAVPAVGLIAGFAISGCNREQARTLPADFLDTNKKLYSQFDEENIIRHFFDDRRDGFFVDVGCSDWQKGSTTLYLEEKLGWTGIAIDAREELRAGWDKNRPGTKFVSFIVTDHSGTKDKFYKAGGISSTNAEHSKQWDMPENFKTEEVEVPTITLNELLDQNGVKNIDFLSMDIEEGEPAALRGFDINRFQPELICIEAGLTVREPISKYMSEHDYERIDAYLKYDKVNWYYAPKKR